MSDVSKCKYYAKKIYNKYGHDINDYCILYEDKCDKYPQCIYRDKQIQQLKAENEELKDMLREANKPCDICINPYSKYKKCLNEIEEICKVHTDFCKDNKKNCELCPHEPCEDILILEKIKEVKNETI